MLVIFKKEFVIFQNIYGLTETTGIVFQSLLDEPYELTENTVGQLSDNMEAKVMVL